MRINEAEVTRFPVPHEPGQWVELRRLSGGQLRKLGSRRFDEKFDRVIEGLRLALVAWSYSDGLIAADDIEAQDGRTLLWLIELSTRHTDGELTDDEKKDATSRLIVSSTASEGSTPTLPTAG
jgi:hypothetical protein